MTVASGYFGTASDSATSGQASWTNTGVLDQGDEAYAGTDSYIAAYTDFADLYLSVPDALVGVPNGSRLTNIEVTFDDKADGWTGTYGVRWSGTVDGVSVTGTLYTHVVSSGVYIGRTYSGSLSYWGLSSYSASAVLKAVRDGYLKFKYVTNATGASRGDFTYLRDVVCECTYDLVDTKRAASVICCP